MADKRYVSQHQQRPVLDDVDPRLVGAQPCPFCRSRWLALSRRGNYVHCQHCGAHGPEIQRTRDDDMWLEAVERWNGRPT